MHYAPYAAAVTEQVGQAMAALVTSEMFTDAQRATLTAFCDTIVPSLSPPAEGNGAGDPHGFWARSASDIGVAEAIEIGLLQADVPEEQLDGVRSLIDALAEEGMAAQTPQEAREQIVLGVENSSPDALAGIATLRNLCLSIFYALPDLGTGRNPNWDAIGYPGPQTPPRAVEKPISLRTPENGELTIEADVCIVGSGAGGGVIAGELAGRGKQVCVIEAGDYFNEADFDGLELPAYQSMYLNGGPFPTAEGQISIMAGSGLGGGTVINWTNCLRTHEWVREEWAREHGLEGLDGSDYEADMDSVLDRVCRPTKHAATSTGVHDRLREGCEKLGYDYRLTMRNTDPDSYDPETAGVHGFRRRLRLEAVDDRRPTSRTPTMPAATWWPTAAPSGSLSRTDARPASRRRGPTRTARGSRRRREWSSAHPRSSSPAGRSSPRRCCCASGIGGPAVGQYLRLHPTTALSGIYDGDQNWAWGPPQAALSHEFADIEDGYGFLLECSQSTTGLFGAATPWTSGREHKRQMLDWTRIAGFINLTRDRGHGQVTIDDHGSAVAHYRLSDELDTAQLPPRPRRDDQASRRRRRAAHHLAGPRLPGLGARRGHRPLHRCDLLQLAGAARPRDLLRAPDGKLPDGDRSADLRRGPVRRAARHEGGLDR